MPRRRSKSITVFPPSVWNRSPGYQWIASGVPPYVQRNPFGVALSALVERSGSRQGVLIIALSLLSPAPSFHSALLIFLWHNSIGAYLHLSFRHYANTATPITNSTPTSLQLLVRFIQLFSHPFGQPCEGPLVHCERDSLSYYIHRQPSPPFRGSATAVHQPQESLPFLLVR